MGIGRFLCSKTYLLYIIMIKIVIYLGCLIGASQSAKLSEGSKRYGSNSGGAAVVGAAVVGASSGLHGGHLGGVQGAIQPAFQGAIQPAFQGGLTGGLISGQAGGYQNNPNCKFWCKDPTNNYYCCETPEQQGLAGQIHPGVCPTSRPVCPPTRLSGGPSVCYNDGGCALQDKCCFDTCLNQKVCKPTLQNGGLTLPGGGYGTTGVSNGVGIVGTHGAIGTSGLGHGVVGTHGGLGTHGAVSTHGVLGTHGVVGTSGIGHGVAGAHGVAGTHGAVGTYGNRPVSHGSGRPVSYSGGASVGGYSQGTHGSLVAGGSNLGHQNSQHVAQYSRTGVKKSD